VIIEFPWGKTAFGCVLRALKGFMVMIPHHSAKHGL
jgi:hypothetical protein